MASTNKTPYFELSQYQPEDRPTYLGDYNSDMSKIDTAMREISVVSDNASNSVATLRDTVNNILDNQPEVQDSLNHLEADISALNSSYTALSSLVNTYKTENDANYSELNGALLTKLSTSDFKVVKQDATPSFLNGPVSFMQFGKCFGFMHVGTTASAQMSANVQNNIGTIQTIYRPIANLRFNELRNKGIFTIGMDGVVLFIPNDTITAGTEIIADFFYPLSSLL